MPKQEKPAGRKSAKSSLDLVVLREVKEVKRLVLAQSKAVNQELDSLGDQLDDMEKLLKEMQEEMEGKGYVSPELQAQVEEISKRATKIDQKVPDKNVPPGSTVKPHKRKK